VGLTKTLDTAGHGPNGHTRGIRSREGELANLVRGVGHRGTVRQPTPSAASIGGSEERAGSRTCRFAEFSEKPLQPAKLVAFRARVRVPHNEP
jgi:hypothetical protein